MITTEADPVIFLLGAARAATHSLYAGK